jgi:hypothetical protein
MICRIRSASGDSGQHLALVGNQRGRFVPRVDAGIGRLAHFAEHVDAAQAIGFAQPFEGRNKAHGTSQREAINKDRFHYIAPSS